MKVSAWRTYKSSDSIKNLTKIIKVFCTASTAVLNLEKTEALPIGEKEYRKNVIKNKTMGNETIPDHIKLIEDGNPMHTLGVWIGDNISIESKWKEITEKQNMDRWSKSRPTFRGKELILKALITSRSWYLATVNGMLGHVEKTMTKNMKDFLWNGDERGLMEFLKTTSERQIGGLDIPNIQARLKAIKIMWLQKYLAPKEKRPDWAWIADQCYTPSHLLSSGQASDPVRSLLWSSGPAWVRPIIPALSSPLIRSYPCSWFRSPTCFMFLIFACFMFPDPQSPSCSTSHRIPLILFLFPLLFPTLCTFSMTLTCSLQYLYAQNFMYVSSV